MNKIKKYPNMKLEDIENDIEYINSQIEIIRLNRLTCPICNTYMENTSNYIKMDAIDYVCQNNHDFDYCMRQQIYFHKSNSFKLKFEKQNNGKRWKWTKL